jgi:CarboxypepD_reg-like domain
MKKRLYLIMIVLFASFSSVLAQVKVSGTVTDPDGISIPGVSVVQKGTTNGTTTDADGKYAVSVSSASAVLQYSFVGMTTTTESICRREPGR